MKHTRICIRWLASKDESFWELSPLMFRWVMEMLLMAQQRDLFDEVNIDYGGEG